MVFMSPFYAVPNMLDCEEWFISQMTVGSWDAGRNHVVSGSEPTLVGIHVFRSWILLLETFGNVHGDRSTHPNSCHRWSEGSVTDGLIVAERFLCRKVVLVS